jgi:hypothetical protein
LADEIPIAVVLLTEGVKQVFVLDGYRVDAAAARMTKSGLIFKSDLESDLEVMRNETSQGIIKMEGGKLGDQHTHTG